MGPRARYLGPDVPSEVLIWQDPLPAVDHPIVTDADVAQLKGMLLACGLSTSQLVLTAWASASSFRGTDKRGGANGARVRLEPQCTWEVNQPKQLAHALARIESVRAAFHAAQPGAKRVSLADLIVLGGCAAIEAAAKKAGHDITVPFTPGRTDASQAQTDAASFAPMEPKADGFRNFVRKGLEPLAAELLIDRANLLTLTAPEMTVLIGGMRALRATTNAPHGILTHRPEALTNDFFVNLLDMQTAWKPSPTDPGIFEGRDRTTGELRWTATIADLIFGSNSQLRALAEVYASRDGQATFVRHFVRAWAKVMELDRFEVG
jgi:catalase-peroxidase